ncbi:MAG: hypothetical protein K6G72_11245, partial [Lachnospiraceae bacterium]|nr:hypothetical protein [Lachnospiraceae bacterium]
CKSGDYFYLYVPGYKKAEIEIDMNDKRFAFYRSKNHSNYVMDMDAYPAIRTDLQKDLGIKLPHTPTLIITKAWYNTVKGKMDFTKHYAIDIQKIAEGLLKADALFDTIFSVAEKNKDIFFYKTNVGVEYIKDAAFTKIKEELLAKDIIKIVQGVTAGAVSGGLNYVLK